MPRGVGLDDRRHRSLCRVTSGGVSPVARRDGLSSATLQVGEPGGAAGLALADVNGTRILLDLGMPLQAPVGGDFPRGTPQRPTEELIAEDALVDLPGVFPDDAAAPAVAAIVPTRSHLDHYGLAHYAHLVIPVYGSEGTLAILAIGRVFSSDASPPKDYVSGQLLANERIVMRWQQVALVGHVGRFATPPDGTSQHCMTLHGNPASAFARREMRRLLPRDTREEATPGS
jgi:hypothetical protein